MSGSRSLRKKPSIDTLRKRRWRKQQRAVALQMEKDAAYAKAKDKRDAVMTRRTAVTSDLPPGSEADVVIMDAASRFSTKGERGMNRTNPANHYVTETWDQIRAKPPPLAANGLLLCWGTQTTLHIILRIIEDDWHLTPKCIFVWDKVIWGTGYWGRSRYEFLIIATCGDGLPTPLPSDRTPNGFVEQARRGHGGHSRKPDAFYAWVMKNYATVRVHEMHARGKRGGEDWTYEGNEVA